MTTISITNGQSILLDDNSKVFILTSDGDKIYPNKGDFRDNRVFDYVFSDGDVIAYDRKKKVVVSYKARQGNPKIKQVIEVETWEKLPEALQALYTSSEETLDVEEISEEEIQVINLDELAETIGNPRVFGRGDVVKLIESYNFKNNKYARAHSMHDSNELNGSNSFRYVLQVDFFDTPYNNETRKILKSKSNGQPYADRRGHFVPDYPRVVNSIVIPIAHIPRFSARSDEEMREKMQSYHDFITQAHLAPKD